MLLLQILLPLVRLLWVFPMTAIGPGELEFTALPVETRSTFELQAVGKLNKATPLYYILAAVPYRLSAAGDLIERMQIQRLFALLISSGIVAIAYLTTWLLFPTNAAMRLTICRLGGVRTSP